MVISYQGYLIGCITHLVRQRVPCDRILRVEILPRFHSFAFLPEIGAFFSAAYGWVGQSKHGGHFGTFVSKPSGR